MDKVLFINSSITACGVHQYGFNIAQTIKKHSKSYDYDYRECNSEAEFISILTSHPYVAVIYNYHPSTIGWATQRLENRCPNVPHIAIVHEPGLHGAPFKYKVSQDPTAEEKPPYFKQYSRNIFDYENLYPDPEVPTIGSFGFAWADKGFEMMVDQIKKEYTVAKVRLHLPKSHFGDPRGDLGTHVASTCADMLKGTDISLEVSREWKSLYDLIDWLAQNTINAFFYDYKDGRGISGPPDFAMAARRPMILTKSYMFKHLWNTSPSIFIEDSSISQVIKQGLKPLEPYYEIWSEEKLTDDYDRIIITSIGMNK
ncbi:MAG: hypothetical protein ACW99G_20260 [Candidatus Thorarchaeota archaeon]|jgi:hypothetical protein